MEGHGGQRGISGESHKLLLPHQRTYVEGSANMSVWEATGNHHHPQAPSTEEPSLLTSLSVQGLSAEARCVRKVWSPKIVHPAQGNSN